MIHAICNSATEIPFTFRNIIKEPKGLFKGESVVLLYVFGNRRILECDAGFGGIKNQDNDKEGQGSYHDNARPHLLSRLLLSVFLEVTIRGSVSGWN